MLSDEHLRALGCGLAGAHRTGKTTIARQLAVEHNAPLIESSAFQIASSMGIKVEAGMPFKDRLTFQEAVLEAFTGAYEQQNGVFFTDRTPLDFAGYLIMDWHPKLTTPEQDAAALDYVRRCIDATSRYFFMVVCVQPGIPYVSDTGKPAPNEAYQELLNTTIVGLAMTPECKSDTLVLPREMLNLRDRVSHVGKEFISGLEDYQRAVAHYFSCN